MREKEWFPCTFLQRYVETETKNVGSKLGQTRSLRS